MKYRLAIASSVLLISQSNAKGTFECTYMRLDEEITVDELTEEKMEICMLHNDHCTCEQMPTKCTFGPDERGEFIFDQVVPDSMAETCHRDFCTCTSHHKYH